MPHQGARVFGARAAPPRSGLALRGQILLHHLLEFRGHLVAVAGEGLTP